METWKLIAAVPPLLVWFGLFLYLGKVERKLKNVEERLQDR